MPPRRGSSDEGPRARGVRSRLHEIVFEAETPLGRAFDYTLIAAIALSVTVVILATMPEIEGTGWESALYTAEWIFTILFTAEYAVRLAVVRRPWRYAISFFGVVDLLAILPAFIGLAFSGGEHLLVIRSLRLLRVFRVFKLARYLQEASALRRALLVSRHKIAVFLTAVLIVVVIASALFHLAEGGANENLDSMPEAMYWAVITMTTVGYGDITPSTVMGRFITAALVLMGYAMIIVPTGILSAEMSAHRRRRVSAQACRNCMREDHDADAAFCKHCGERL